MNLGPVMSSTIMTSATLYERTRVRFAHFREAILVFFLFTLLTLIATFPLLLHFDVAVIGGGDTSQNAWNLWWVQQGLSRGELFPYDTQAIYHPLGISLAYHPLGVLNGWISFFLQGLGLSLVSTYNAITVLTFTGTGLTTYFLVASLTQNRGAALVAGIIFTFAPIRMSRLFFGNLEMYSTQFIPLMVLFFLVMLKTGRHRYAFLASLFFAMTAWCSLYLAYGAGLLIVMLFISGLISARTDLRIWLWTQSKALLLFAITTLILVLPVILPMGLNYSDFQDQSDQMAAATSNSADLLGFFVPDRTTDPLSVRFSPSFRSFVENTYATFYGNPAEKTVFLGYTVIATVLVSLFMVRRKGFLQWQIMAAIFFLLCLGPVLHIGGQQLLSHLPYEWLGSIPFVSFGRSPSRFAIFLMLALAVISGYGLATLERKNKSFRWLTLTMGILIFMEFLIVPVRMDMRFAQIPSFYSALAEIENQTNWAILDVPVDLIGAQGPAGEYMLYQTSHQKPIVSGYISRTPTHITQIFESPFIYELRARIYGDTAPFDLDETFFAQAPLELRRLNIEYVVLHRWTLNPLDFDTLSVAFTALLADPIYEDDQITVWRTYSIASE